MITELQTLVATTKTQLAVAKESTAMTLATPTIAQVRELARTVVPSDAEAAKQRKAGTDHGSLYSEALRGKVKHTQHTLTVSFNESKSADTIKEILKSNFNPTEINPLNPELNPICYLLALLGAHNFLHVSRIKVKSLTFRGLSYIWSTHS